LTRIDMSTREWHELLKPVLPHACTDKDAPELAVVRIESDVQALYAVAFDRYTLGAERHPLGGTGERAQAVHIDAKEAAATLRLFTFSKDEDPMLHITIDTVSVPVVVVGQSRSINTMGVTLSRDDGTRLAMHDRRDPSRDPLAGWRKIITSALERGQGRALDGLDLSGYALARWAHAVRGGERLTVYTGPKPGDALLITVERHFAGVWAIPQYLDAPAKVRGELPWLAEIGADTETGEKLGDA
jgi:hypothetical protein